MKIHHFTNGPAPAGTAQPPTKYWNVVTSEDMDSAEITLTSRPLVVPNNKSPWIVINAIND